MNEPTQNNRLGIDTDSGKAVFNAASLLKSLGGWWGVVESVIPTVIYVSVFTFSKSVAWAAGAAGVVALSFIVRQLTLRKPLSSALVGAASVAIAIFLPLREGGRASDYFTVGLLTNLGYLAAMVLSILIRFPIVGVLVGALNGAGLSWRKNRALLRRFDGATLLWVGLFGTRLIIEAPLYFANQLEALGIVKIVLGVPFYAVTLWLTWLVVRSTFANRS